MPTPKKNTLQPYPNFDGTQNCIDRDINELYEEYKDRRQAVKLKKVIELKVMCGLCKFKDPCFNWAIHHERYGFWAGMTELERDRYRNANKIRCTDPLYESMLQSKDGLLETRT